MSRSAAADTDGGPGSGKASFDPQLRGILEPAEQVLWAGRPRPFRVMRSKAVRALFGAVALVMLTTVSFGGFFDLAVHARAPHQDMMWKLIGGSILLFGVYSVLMPAAAYCRAGRTWYAVTDRRILRLQHGRVDASAGLEEVSLTSVRSRNDGTGDILFIYSFTRGIDDPARRFPGIFGIDEAEAVQRTINEARDEISKRGGNAVHDYLEFLLQARRPAPRTTGTETDH